MANTIGAFGVLPFGQMEGTAPTAGFTRCFIASSDTGAIFYGDTVKDSSSLTLGPNAPNYVTADASGLGVVRGIFMGCEYYNSNVGRMVWSRNFPGSVGSSLPDVIAYVMDNPQQLCIAQGSSAVTSWTSLVGTNCGMTVAGTGSSLDGHSSAVVSSQVGSTNVLPFRIVDTYANYGPPGANGTDNTTAGAYLILRPNNFSRNNLTARTS